MPLVCWTSALTATPQGISDLSQITYPSDSSLVTSVTINIYKMSSVLFYNCASALDGLPSSKYYNSQVFYFNANKFDESLLSAPLTLKEYIFQYKCNREIFYLKERLDIEELEKEFANKNFFNSKVVKIFKFMVAIISIIATVVTIYVICKHNKLRALVTSLALQQVKEVKVENTENVDYNCECTVQLYIILTLSIIMIGLIIFAILQLRRIKLCRGKLFSNVVKIMLFI